MVVVVDSEGNPIYDTPVADTVGYLEENLPVFCEDFCCCINFVKVNNSDGDDEVYIDIYDNASHPRFSLKHEFKNWKSGLVAEAYMSGSEQKEKIEEFIKGYSNPNVELKFEYEGDLINGWWLSIYNHEKVSFFKRWRRYSMLLSKEGSN